MEGGRARGRDIFKEVISSLWLMLIGESDVSHVRREREGERSTNGNGERSER